MKKIWAIADLHLSFGTENKDMSLFGPNWIGWTEKIERHWKRHVSQDDLVLIPGDISWAKRLDEALVDLLWLDALPGTKVILRGNHDYWWTSLQKLESHLPSTLKILHNQAVNWNHVSIAGTRLWDSPAYHCLDLIDFEGDTYQKKLDEIEETRKENQRLYHREIHRLELSLQHLDPKARLKIAMTHYPPLDPSLKRTPVTDLLETYGIDLCVFGHLHKLKKPLVYFGEKNGIRYYLTSSDVLNFCPLEIAEFY